MYGSTKGEAAEGGSGSFSGLVLRPTDYLHHNHKSKKRCLDYQVELDLILYCMEMIGLIVLYLMS